MGLSGMPQVDGGGLESEGKRWVIAGIPLRAPLKPIYTNPAAVVDNNNNNNNSEVDNSGGGDGTDEEFSSTTTPTSEEARIPAKLLTCPAAPRKRKSSLKCNYSGVREFFITPPDLESVFIRHVERAN